jgi:hypothetical protein
LHAIQRAEIQDDPTAHILRAFSDAIGALHDARLPVTEDSIRRLEEAAVRGADRRAAMLARQHSIRTLLIAAGVLVGAMIASLGAGYWVGWSRANDTARSAEAHLAAFFADGAMGAARWADLASWNDISLALAQCNKTNSGIQQGRHMCAVPLWVGPPKSGGDGR